MKVSRWRPRKSECLRSTSLFLQRVTPTSSLLVHKKKLDNNSVVGMSVNLSRDRFGWPRCVEGRESRQHKASKDRLVLPVGHDVIVLVPGAHGGVCLLPKELGNKVAKLHSPILCAKLTFLTKQAKTTRLKVRTTLPGCEFQSMVLSLAVVAVQCERPQTRRNRSLQVAFVMSCSLTNQILAQLDAQSWLLGTLRLHSKQPAVLCWNLRGHLFCLAEPSLSAEVNKWHKVSPSMALGSRGNNRLS